MLHDTCPSSLSSTTPLFSDLELTPDGWVDVMGALVGGVETMRALLLLGLLPRADAANKLSTWVSPGAGGPMGNDLTEALAWVTVSSFTPGAGAPAPRCRH